MPKKSKMERPMILFMEALYQALCSGEAFSLGEAERTAGAL
jgi:hypothetical protein